MTPKPPDQFDLLRSYADIPKSPPPHVPHQASSLASKQAGETIAPVFGGNRETCLRMIVSRGRITRKQIAAEAFNSQQMYVTGPVAVLIEEKSVYEEPRRGPDGEIMKREDGTIIPVRIDGSAVLMATEKGRLQVRASA